MHLGATRIQSFCGQGQYDNEKSIRRMDMSILRLSWPSPTHSGATASPQLQRIPVRSLRGLAVLLASTGTDV